MDIGLYIGIAVVAGVFAFLWSKGYLVKIRNYIAPTVEELKGSTVVVMVTLALLGVFTVGVDWVLSLVVRLITA